MQKLWQTVVQEEEGDPVERLPVPGGWIYKVSAGLYRSNIVFVQKPIERRTF